MRGLLLAAVIAAGAAVVPPAGADPMWVTGNPCSFTSNGGFPADDWAGVLWGGPQKLSGIGGPADVTGTLRCTLVVVPGSFAFAHHDDPGVVATTVGPQTQGVAVAPPVPAQFHLALPYGFGVCARVDLAGGGTWYWDDMGLGRWSADPHAVCTETTIPLVPESAQRYVVAAARVVCTASGGDVYVGDEWVLDCP